MADKKPETVGDALSRVSGVSREEIHAIWEQVKANSARLAACAGPHDFGPLEKKLGAKYSCAKCGGSVDGIARSWYERGLAHGRL